MNRLKSIFEPNTIAVVGASEKPGTIGHAVFSNILESGYKGIIYPVNPKYENVMSIKAYGRVDEIPDKIDMAIIIVPKKAVREVMKQCGMKKVEAAVVITAGFKEAGTKGKELEEEIAALAHKHDIALVGPNCLGLINTSKDFCLNATFAVGMPHHGHVALISQSGAIGIAALDYAQQHELGISKFISIGNKAVIDESDMLEYLIHDDSTKIITMYVEDISNPGRFFKMAKKANAKQKPVIVIKTGRSVRGAAAIHSHTGALSSSDTAYDSLFAQCGVIRVVELSELFEYAKVFTCGIEPKGKRVAIVTNAGGMGIIATDAMERNKLEMASFSDHTLKQLKKVLPAEANTDNPVDVIGDADAQRITDALSIIVKDKNTDVLIVSVTPTIKTDMDEIARAICKIAKANPELPVLTNLMSLDTDPAFEKILERANIPNFLFPEINVRALAVMISYFEKIKLESELPAEFSADKKRVKNILQGLAKEKRERLSEAEMYGILEAYGFKVMNFRVAGNEEEAVNAASEITYPVVMKILSADILHKVDVGGVKINLQNEAAVRTAFKTIEKNIHKLKPKPVIQGFLIQKYFAANGIEIILGANAVKGFGPLIMFGLGGTLVELFKDVAFRLAPLSKQDARNMIMETKGYQILKGYRGHAPYDVTGIIDYLLRLSQLVSDFPEIKEIDMNPVKVLEKNKGIIVMDAKAILSEKEKKPYTKKNKRLKQEVIYV